MNHLAPALLIFIFASIIIIGLTIFAWRLYNSPVGRAFFFLTLFASIWCIGATLEMLPQRMEWRIFLANLEFIGITFLPATQLYLVLTYLDRQPSPKLTAILSIVPILTNLVIWTDPLHHWFRGQPYFITTHTPFPVLVYDYHFWFYSIHAPAGYLYLLISIGIAVRAIVTLPALYRRQITLFILALLIPSLTDVAYVLGYSPIPHFNLTPATFSLSSLLISWNLFGFRFLDLLPLARDFVFENIDEGIIIIDKLGRIVDFNLAARRMAQVSGEEVGKTLAESSAFLLERVAEMSRHHITTQDIEVGETHKLFYEIRLYPIQKNEQYVGQIVNIRDITERTELYNKVHQLAIRDSLTNAYTRRHFLEFARHSLDFIARNPDYQISILMLDIDNFKEINDAFGHDAGDQALQELTSICQEYIRPMDMLSRWGGDEFAILLENIDREQSVQVAERIRKHFEGLDISTKSGNIRITISLGLVSSGDLSKNELEAENLLHLADKALYDAKIQGRNQMAIYSN
jgi:diguanylate cyclase (GGDEF)-like protein/PAS domain S-box-containing protein